MGTTFSGNIGGSMRYSLDNNNTNPDWNNLPSQYTAKQCQDLDELLDIVRSYGGGGGGEEDEIENINENSKENTPKSKIPDKSSHIPHPTTSRIYPEGSQSTSQKQISPTGRALVSLK